MTRASKAANIRQGEREACRSIVCDDPIELIVMRALEEAGIPYVHESQDNVATLGLDFRLLVDPNVFLECKAYWTPRTARQIDGVANVIVVQGKEAAMAFARMICPARELAKGEKGGGDGA